MAYWIRLAVMVLLGFGIGIAAEQLQWNLPFTILVVFVVGSLAYIILENTGRKDAYSRRKR